MRSFPNEATMEKSPHSGESIRGGSMGLNRILNYFATHAEQHRSPAFKACLLSAFTIFRNIKESYKTSSIEELEQAFVQDVSLFLDYYDIYLSSTKTQYDGDKRAIVIVYFPNYQRVEKDLLREPNKDAEELANLYARFYRRFNGRDERVRDLEHVSCFWIRAGDATYPHKEVARKFRDIVGHPKSLYTNGDPIAMMSHVPLDFHIMGRLRNIVVMESYTGLVRPGTDIKARVDKEGRLPFNTTTHLVFGDKVMIKPMITPKIRKLLLEQAEKEKWVSRGEDDIRQRIVKTASIPMKDLRKYDFV